MKIGVILDNEFDHDHRVQKQVRQLLRAGHTVYVLCFDYGKTYKNYGHQLTVCRIPIAEIIKNGLVMLNIRFPFYENLWAKHICKFIKRYKIEALHSHDLYMAKASYKGIRSSGLKLPLTIDLHENYPSAINSYQWAVKGWRKLIVNPKKWFKKEFEYLNYADRIITLSNSFKESLLKKYPALNSKEFAIHPNLPDFKSFEAFDKASFEVDYSSAVPTLFYFGVVAQRRGIIDLLPWFEKALEADLGFNILIIGPVDKADEEKFNKYLTSELLKKNTTYLPWANISLLPSYLKKITIGLAPFEVNPQHDSGVANKLYQYMYGGIPILATACKAQKELIDKANCGLIYTDYESFKAQLKTMLDNEAYREVLGNNGKKKLLQLYKTGVDQEFLEFYK